jgi:hypothetical protein
MLITVQLGKEAVFPAAAHLSMASEALRQVCDRQRIEIESVTFRDILIKAALIVPDNGDGIEVQLRLDKKQDDRMWYTFAVESFSEGQWILHSEGLIAPNHVKSSSLKSDEHPVDTTKLTQRVFEKTWYSAFDRVGFEYGPSFQTLSNIRTNSKYHHATADVKVDTESGLMTGESRYMLHPSTIDGCLQLVIISINSGMHREMQYGVVPIKIEELTMWTSAPGFKATGRSIAWTDELDGRYFNTHTKLVTQSGDVLLDVRSLRCVSYEAAVPQKNAITRPREPYMETVWQPDIATLTNQQVLQVYPTIVSEEDSIAAVVELTQHKRPISRVILLGQVDSQTLQAILKKIAFTTQVVLADVSEKHIQNFISNIEAPNVTTIVTQNGLFDWGEQALDSQDLVIVGKYALNHVTEQELLDGVAALASKGGKVIFSVANAEAFGNRICSHGFSHPELFFSLAESSIITSTHIGSDSNGQSHQTHRVIIFTLNGLSRSSSAILGAFLQERGCVVESKDILEHMHSNQDKEKETTYIIDDSTGSLISSLTDKTFETLKIILTGSNPVIWLSTGVNEGSCVSGAMSQGLLRAIRSEQAAAKILLLDANSLEEPVSIGEAVLGKLGHITTKDSGADTEYWLQNGILKIPRVLPNGPLNTQFSANLAPPQATLLLGAKNFSGSVTDGELVFQSQSLGQSSIFTEYDVEMQVQYASLNKTDLQGQSNSIAVVAGPIIGVGSGLDQSFVGQNAVAYAHSSFGTVLKAPITLGAFYSDFEAPALLATLPSLAKGTNAILDVGKIQANERVLLLPAPRDFVVAAVEFKNALGFQLTVVVESDQERRDLMSETGLDLHEILISSDAKAIRSLLGANGIDKAEVVISHDFSSFSQEIWRSMPPASRFILNDGIIEGNPDALPFSKGVSLLLSGVGNLYKRRPSALGDLLSRTMCFMKEHKILWKPDVHDISSLKDVVAFSRSQESTRNAVIKYDYGHSSISVSPDFLTLSQSLYQTADRSFRSNHQAN